MPHIVSQTGETLVLGPFYGDDFEPQNAVVNTQHPAWRMAVADLDRQGFRTEIREDDPRIFYLVLETARYYQFLFNLFP